jgi:hypothetical protein
MKIRAFWDIAPCSIVKVDQRFGDAYCLHHQGDGDPFTTLMMEAVHIYETSVYSNETTWLCIPEGCHLQIAD